MLTRYSIAGVLVAATVGIFALGARAESEKQIAGRAAAENVCARCHEVGTKQIPGRRLGDGTPPAFVVIAQDPKMTPEVLRRYIRFPHGAMDMVFITQREADALVGYIQSLKPTAQAVDKAPQAAVRP